MGGSCGWVSLPLVTLDGRGHSGWLESQPKGQYLTRGAGPTWDSRRFRQPVLGTLRTCHQHPYFPLSRFGYPWGLLSEAQLTATCHFLCVLEGRHEVMHPVPKPQESGKWIFSPSVLAPWEDQQPSGYTVGHELVPLTRLAQCTWHITLWMQCWCSFCKTPFLTF